MALPRLSDPRSAGGAQAAQMGHLVLASPFHQQPEVPALPALSARQQHGVPCAQERRPDEAVCRGKGECSIENTCIQDGKIAASSTTSSGSDGYQGARSQRDSRCANIFRFGKCSAGERVARPGSRWRRREWSALSHGKQLAYC